MSDMSLSYSELLSCLSTQWSWRNTSHSVGILLGSRCLAVPITRFLLCVLVIHNSLTWWITSESIDWEWWIITMRWDIYLVVAYLRRHLISLNVIISLWFIILRKFVFKIHGAAWDNMILFGAQWAEYCMKNLNSPPLHTGWHSKMHPLAKILMLSIKPQCEICRMN